MLTNRTNRFIIADRKYSGNLPKSIYKNNCFFSAKFFQLPYKAKSKRPAGGGQAQNITQ